MTGVQTCALPIFAIMNKETGSFMTKFFLPESNDDVVGYVPGDELETMLNEIVGKNFQVI